MIQIPNIAFNVVWDFCILEVLSYVVLRRQVVKELRLQTVLLAVIAGLLLALLLKPQPHVGRFILSKGENEESALDTVTGRTCFTVHDPAFKPTVASGPECSTLQ